MTDTPDINALSEVAVPVTYTNWRGETKRIRLILSGGLRFGTTDWHDQPTWLFSGFDVDHPAQIWKEYDLTKTVFDAGQLFTTADVEAARAEEREALIAAAEMLLPKDMGEIQDAGRDYCAGVRDVVAALKALTKEPTT